MDKCTHILLSLLCLSFAPLAAADSASVVVDGECYDEDDQSVGGEDDLAVSYDTESRTATVTHPGVVGAVNAAAALVLPPGDPAGGTGCDSGGDDHLSVDVNAVTLVTDVHTGVCYDGTEPRAEPCPSA